jgi:outer membrane receptor protein involved in Fe transport
MKRLATIIITLSILFINLGSYAAEAPGLVKGKVIDSKTKEPIEFVTVSVKKKGVEGYLPKATVTDHEGNFLLGNLSDDTYTLNISFVGYTPFERDITITSSANTINLKQISLSENDIMLNEVQVTGIRSQMKFELDKKIFNVDQSIASTGGTASDVLSNIPSVEVDNEGEVSLRGNTAVTIWINGKASGLSAENRAQILQQLPAETIEKIEVITNPSAKYSPEGTAGIINIVLKEDRKAGYYGSAQVGGDTRGGYNASANINYNSGKLDAYASLGFRHREHKNGGYTDRTNIGSNGSTTYLNQNSYGKGDGNNIFTRMGLTYRATKNDHLSLNGFGMFGSGNRKNTVDYLSNIPNSYYQSQRITSSDNDMNGGNIQLGYKRVFSENSNLDFTVSYNQWNMDGTSVFNQSSLYANGTETASYQKQTNDINNRNWEFQLDYTNTINESHKIEAGYKGTLGHENSPVETMSGANESSATPTPELYNRFIYDQDIHAIYATYSGKYNKFNYQVGLRGEYSNIETKSPGYGQTESDVTPYKNDYFSLFPSAFISYSLPDNNEVQINYTRRISRPWGGQLNPFMNITDSTNISFGNPRLSPQYSNAFELNYIKSWDNHMFSLSGYYRTTDDVIQRIRFLDGSVMKTTFENVSQTISAGSEFVLKNRLFKILDLTTTVNLFYYKLDDFSYMPEGAVSPVTGEAQEDFSWNARMIANVALPKSYSLQLNGSYNAREVVAQGYRRSNYSLDGGIRKSFNDLSVSINARDILDSRKRKMVTSGAGFEQISENWWGGRQFGITLTYSFGNMKGKRPQNREPQGGSDYNMEGGDYQ